MIRAGTPQVLFHSDMIRVDVIQNVLEICMNLYQDLEPNQVPTVDLWG